MNFIETYNCQVCGNKLADPKLNLGNHPLCDDLIPISENIVCDEYPISISLCEKCLTANQTYNVKKEKLFPQEYHYRPCSSNTVSSISKCNIIDVSDQNIC